MPSSAAHKTAAWHQEGSSMMKIAKEKVFAVIMAGGKGERLWPISTEDRPKPLVAFDGEQTLLEETVQRLFPLLNAENIMVVTDKKSAVPAKELLPIPEENIIVEPCRRNTAPCIALAAALIRRKCEDALMIVLPADHRITPVRKFQEDLAACLEQAQKGSLTLLGAVPDQPATGYGYIKLAGEIAPGICEVERFKEKPDLETAKSYMESKEYLWNCGIFVWQVSRIAGELKVHCPALYEKWKGWSEGKDYNEDFADCPGISIDYAVMEKACNVAVRKASFLWNDLGTFRSLYEISEKDPEGNAVRAGGEVLLDGSGHNLVYCDDDTLIRLRNLDHCAVIKSGKMLLVTSKWE